MINWIRVGILLCIFAALIFFATYACGRMEVVATCVNGCPSNTGSETDESPETETVTIVRQPGPPGPKGDSGERGTQGSSGPTGGVGTTGDRGELGPTGQAGANGGQGPTGSEGVSGATGDAGPTGDRGDSGPTGAIGSTGASGSDGVGLVFTTVDASSCENGGVTYLMARDVNHNGSLDNEDEDLASSTVCNGENAPPTPFTTVEIIDPCGDAPGIWDEVFLRLADGTLLASFSDDAAGDNTRFSLLVPGTYVTTDGSSCIVTVHPDMSVTW